MKAREILELVVLNSCPLALYGKFMIDIDKYNDETLAVMANMWSNSDDYSIN